MSSYTPDEIDGWMRETLESITYRRGDLNLTIGEGRAIHAPRLSRVRGIRVTIPLCSSSPSTGPIGMESTHRDVTCQKCAARLHLIIPGPRQPTLC